MGPEPKTIQTLHRQHCQPKVKRQTGEGCEKNPFPRIWFLVFPIKQRRYESDEEDESVDDEQNQENLAETEEVTTQASVQLSGTMSHNVVSEKHSRHCGTVSPSHVGEQRTGPLPRPHNTNPRLTLLGTARVACHTTASTISI